MTRLEAFQMQYEDIYLYLFIVITIYLGIFTCHLIIKAVKTEEEGRNYLYGIALFSGFYMISRIFLNIDLWLWGQTNTLDPLYQWGSFFALLGFFAFMFAVEKYVYQRLKFIPSIFILASAALVLIFPRYDSINLITYWALIASAFALLIPFLYLKVGLNSMGEVRSKSLFLAFAIIVFVIGKGLNFAIFINALPILRIIVPSIMLCGLILFHIGIVR